MREGREGGEFQRCFLLWQIGHVSFIREGENGVAGFFKGVYIIHCYKDGVSSVIKQNVMTLALGFSKNLKED